MAHAKYDWNLIRDEYVNSPIDIKKDELAAKYGMKYGTIIRKSLAEHWDIDHERFLMRVAEQRTEQKALAVAAEGKQWDAECLKEAKALMSLVKEELAGSPVYVKGKPLIVEGHLFLAKKPAKDIAAAMKMAQEIGKIALGDKPNAEFDGVNIIIGDDLIPKDEEKDVHE